jgi:hypothetical protein
MSSPFATCPLIVLNLTCSGFQDGETIFSILLFLVYSAVIWIIATLVNKWKTIGAFKILFIYRLDKRQSVGS